MSSIKSKTAGYNDVTILVKATRFKQYLPYLPLVPAKLAKEMASSA
jgi:hypothetical protein